MISTNLQHDCQSQYAPVWWSRRKSRASETAAAWRRFPWTTRGAVCNQHRWAYPPALQACQAHTDRRRHSAAHAQPNQARVGHRPVRALRRRKVLRVLPARETARKKLTKSSLVQRNWNWVLLWRTIKIETETETANKTEKPQFLQQ